MQTNGLFMIFRHMRLPLIVLITSYAISILGFVLIPGRDDQGNVWHMDFFHAFYFVSFMGSTIGFGEIPYPFTEAQRLWTTFALYSTVVSWLYAIGSLLAISQSRPFRQILKQAGFTHKVNKLTDSFYIICGYGDACNLILTTLTRQGIKAVVIDSKESNIESLEIADLPLEVAALCADPSDSEVLVSAGLQKENCRGVLAITDDDQVNLMIAIASKLISPQMTVICCAVNKDTEVNMASFGTDYVVNPFTSFADLLAISIQSPNLFLLMEWLTDNKYRASDHALAPPRGRWIICGYGRFGKAFEKFLSYIGCEIIIIEADPIATDTPKNAVVGRGTEAITLREAKIKESVGIIAGTNNDANNLSIIMTAQELNPDIFCVVRQNLGYNQLAFQAANSHWLMQPGRIISRKILTLINIPLLYNFIHLARHENEEWAKKLNVAIAAMLGDNIPHCWAINLNKYNAPAFIDLSSEYEIDLATLIRDPSHRMRSLLCIPLLLKRGDKLVLLPDGNSQLMAGDSLLFCGHETAENRLAEAINDIYLLYFLMTGKDQPRSSLFRAIKHAHPLPRVSQ